MTVLFNGVYQIRNLENGKRYVGSAAARGGFKKRWDSHRNALYRGDHENEHLQRAWNKYGEQAFKFEVLLICDIEDCLVYEQFALDTGLFEYNICPIVGSTLGRRHTEETKKKMSEARKGIKLSSSSKQKIREAKRYGGAHNTKLTPDKVRNIRSLLSCGISNKLIAQQFEVSECLVSNIKAGRAWSYIK